MFWFREIISHAYEIWIWFHIPWNQSWFHIWNMDMISWFHIVWFHVLYMHAYMIGLTMISWVWFHTWNYDFIGNLKSYVLVSWYHIPCIWFQWYDVIYQYITMWYHIRNLDMISWFYIVWYHMLYMHACHGYDFILETMIS